MMQLCRFGRALWQNGPCRWFIIVVLPAFIGIAAGHTVIALSGSVSVVDGSSMAPTFEPGARLYTAPISAPLQRGDIVLLDDGQKEYALKRIIGLPGETIKLWRGYVFVNHRLLREPYLPKHTYTFPDEHCGTYRFRLEANQYFVLGDNRLCSVDSRTYGPVDRAKIKSRVPWPDGAPRAEFAAYTLPADGKRTIRPL